MLLGSNLKWWIGLPRIHCGRMVLQKNNTIRARRLGGLARKSVGSGRPETRLDRPRPLGGWAQGAAAISGAAGGPRRVGSQCTPRGGETVGPWRRRGDDPLPNSQLSDPPPDNQPPLTKGDIQLLLTAFHKDINVLRQDFMRTLSDLDESVRQIDSRLTTVELNSADQVLEDADRTTRIEKLETNYTLLQDKLDDLENRSRRNHIRIRRISANPTSELETHVQALFTHMLGPDCDQLVLLIRTHWVFSTY
ncbi:hypothetical protein NDU88_005635 [Pleurodeles waltl]|uniref:Uncharacterized protein n=1 Tax=Pleurodeles waltl TaxID=8319 RepID=A0AAV7MWX1_PLEWA|nr:hypothetical protein NDU88_005635 [Pleurodeles waltl]